MLALGAVALFGAGFGLGWLVRGERLAPVDLASAAAATDAGASADGSIGEGAARGGASDGGARAGRGAAEPGEASGRAGEAGGVAVVGADSRGAGSGGGGAGAGGGEGTGEAARASADGGVRGRLDASAIRDVVSSHRDELGFCFAWQLHQRPDLGGRVVMEFEIGPDGRVSEARVADDELGDETVARCFLGVTRRMEFPAPEGGPVTVRYPFILSPDAPSEED